MRKHDVRKWLHAILDLLPVILIPVFMIYSHRHEINDGSIQVQEKIAIDFNQKLNINVSERTSYGITYSVQDNVVYADGIATGTFYQELYAVNNPNYLVPNHVYYVKLVPYNHVIDSDLYKNVYFVSSSPYIQSASSVRFTCVNSNYFILRLGQQQGAVYDHSSFVINLFDLTQMFGVGNEPTIEEFDNLFTDSVYPYVESQKMLIDSDLVTLNDTDIMSQFTYQLYNSVDKYFNMGNVFHLNEVYDWFNLNIFNGQAPIYIFIVYQIVLYELIMDLLMLLYALFMWFIDMIEKLMEKPLNSIK